MLHPNGSATNSMSSSGRLPFGVQNHPEHRPHTPMEAEVASHQIERQHAIPGNQNTR
jgi:hypothetical protein